MKRMISAIIAIAILTIMIPWMPQTQGTNDIPTRAGNVLYVAPVNSTYLNITDAVDNATDGDTIHVAPGNYSGWVQIRKDGISLMGNSSEGDVRIIDGSEGMLTVGGSWVNVSGFIIGDDRNHMGLISVVNTHNVTLSDIEAESEQLAEGIYIGYAKDIAISDISIHVQDFPAVRIHGSNTVSIEDFSFSSGTPEDGVVLSRGGSDMIHLKYGNIELRGTGTAIYTETSDNMVIDTVTATYTEKFVSAGTGNVTFYDTIVDPDDAEIRGSSPSQEFNSYFRREVEVTGIDAHGMEIPLEGAHLVAETDGSTIYASDHYGGGNGLSDPDGSFPGQLMLLSWWKQGGRSGFMNGTSFGKIWFEGDMEQEIDLGMLDANVTDTVTGHFDMIYLQLRSLNGTVSYFNGPMAGTKAANATVTAYGFNMTEIANSTTDVNGTYLLEDLPVDMNITVVVVPVDEVERDGPVSGYLRREFVVNISEDSTTNADIEYYEFIPVSGPIFGWIRYQEGPRDGQFVEGATVKLYNTSGDEVGSMLSNETGYYEFTDMAFGDGYEVRVTPPEEELGINLEKTGYLFWDGSAFGHNGSTRINASVKYYLHVEVTHPEIIIKDEDGNPLEGVTVIVTIDGETYTETTDENGKAVFEDLDMDTFPNGTGIEASKAGYETLTWSWPDTPPPMKEQSETENTLVLFGIIALIVIVIGLAIVLLFVRKVPEEEYEE
ncbi:MAG: hypothetical protein ACMUHB_05640 [Thermoplasmatota archaeon]